MKRKHKQYSKPKRPFDKTRMDEEAKIRKEYGLKNKKEIWKADSQINSIREKAKKLISAGKEEQQALFNKLKKKGIGVNSIGDVLSLDTKNYLDRRLQTIVYKKKLAPTIKTARQFITHKKVLVDGKAVDSPSYIVPIKMEEKITVKKIGAKPKKKGAEVKKQGKESEIKEISEENKSNEKLGEKEE